MSYENTKLKRANELFTVIKTAEAELEALFVEAQQAKRGRPRKENGDSRTVEETLPLGGDTALDQQA